MEKSILYSKITVSQKNSLKTQFQMLYRPFIFIVIIMSKINNNNNNIYLKSSIQTSSIDYTKYNDIYN